MAAKKKQADAEWRRAARSAARKGGYKVIRPKGSYHPPKQGGK